MSRLLYGALHDDSPLLAAIRRPSFETHKKCEAIPVPAKSRLLAPHAKKNTAFIVTGTEETTELREKFTATEVAWQDMAQ